MSMKEHFHKFFLGWYDARKAECEAYNEKIDELQKGEGWVTFTEKELARLEAQCKKDGISVVKHKPPYFLALNHATNELRCNPRDDGTYSCCYYHVDPSLYW